MNTDIQPAVASWTKRRRDEVIEYTMMLGFVGGGVTSTTMQVGNGVIAAWQALAAILDQAAAGLPH